MSASNKNNSNVTARDSIDDVSTSASNKKNSNVNAYDPIVGSASQAIKDNKMSIDVATTTTITDNNHDQMSVAMSISLSVSSNNDNDKLDEKLEMRHDVKDIYDTKTWEYTSLPQPLINMLLQLKSPFIPAPFDLPAKKK
eukprot:56339_1